MTTVIVYWMATLLLSSLYLASAGTYLIKNAWVREKLGELGYPGYLKPLMVTVKTSGVAAILIRLGPALSDLAYAGIFYHLLLSGLAHLGVRKPAGAIPAVIGIALLATSFATQNAARTPPSPYAPAAASATPGAAKS